jgi:transposase InsO family protein
LINFGLLGNKTCSSLDLSFDCTSCKLGKSKVLPFPRHASRASQCFDIIHSDVWGIAPVVSHAHYKYFVTFIDDFSRFTWVYFLRAKAEVFSVFKCFLALLETKFSARIKVLRSDSSGEYMSNEFHVFLQSKGIISQRFCPSTPQQNGVAERKNRHLLDVVRTLLLESSVPPRFLCETLSTSVHLINRLPSPTLNHVSPFFKLFGHSSLYSNLRTFGCVCYFHLPTHERYKLTTQSVKCAFLGYAIPQKGYVCYDPHVRRIRVSRNVIFFKNQYFFPSHIEQPSAFLSLLPSFSDSTTIMERFKPGFIYERRNRHESGSTSPVLPSDLDSTPDPASTSTTLRRSTRPSRPPNWYGFFSPVSLVATLSTISIPSC